MHWQVQQPNASLWALRNRTLLNSGSWIWDKWENQKSASLISTQYAQFRRGKRCFCRLEGPWIGLILWRNMCFLWETMVSSFQYLGIKVRWSLTLGGRKGGKIFTFLVSGKGHNSAVSSEKPQNSYKLSSHRFEQWTSSSTGKNKPCFWEYFNKPYCFIQTLMATEEINALLTNQSFLPISHTSFFTACISAGISVEGDLGFATFSFSAPFFSDTFSKLSSLFWSRSIILESANTLAISRAFFPVFENKHLFKPWK